ncbi:replicative DNA helicase [Rhodophyticola porphyridii]|uniref:Replicative DNA helicase n=1 Tax=Rhodophyticola porphyridii TaxID=1852017 RepID=A0A3L9XZU6_9RHOB|nr:replicative DNA helicase [Rhodophyticola porphyridii]RMA42079.1 replicative DNA helicase [Rhodophyticola porphyridii]
MNEVKAINPTGAALEAAPELPHNIEAEQQLLGAILSSNDVLDRVDDLVKPDHFYDPVHGEIFATAASRITKGLQTDATTLKNFLADHPGLKDLGGAEYLLRLQLSAIATSAARDYAQLIHDLALRRELIDLGRTIADRAQTVRDDATPDEQIVEAEADLFKLASSGTTSRGFQSFLRALTDAVDIANAAYNRGGGLAGISTGLVDMDKMLGGLHNSDLLILAGRPSMGKTSLATNIAFNVAKSWKRGQKPDGSDGTVDGGVVGFFSLEMSAAQLAQRVLSEAAEVPSELIRKGDLNEQEFQRYLRAAQDLESCPLYIDDTPALPISQLAARARRLKRSPQGLDLLIVDYLQLLRGGGKSENRVNEVSEITQGLKAVAKELNIPVIALSQLSRQVEQREDKRPQLSDLRESGSIEQDADVVMFVYRGEYYKEREKPGEDNLEAMAKWQQEMEQLHGKAEVIIGKQRHGPVGSVDLSFEGRFTRFGNLVKPWQAAVEGDGFR